ncbi:YeeE/YedE family protein [Marinicella sp. X102]|nr:YeeE/YedE family protein [Marinicella marina]
MTNPEKVIGFLDWFGEWDPTLLYVMVGAVITVGIGYPLILKNEQPILDSKFQIPSNSLINRRLLVGSAIFGLGWGSSGYCPGPALANLSYNSIDAAVFILFMIGGFQIAKLFSTE